MVKYMLAYQYSGILGSGLECVLYPYKAQTRGTDLMFERKYGKCVIEIKSKMLSLKEVCGSEYICKLFRKYDKSKA